MTMTMCMIWMDISLPIITHSRSWPTSFVPDESPQFVSYKLPEKVVYSQPRTGFILGAFTIAVPSKNISEYSQPSWVRSLHSLPSSICVLHFHALHEFCTLSGRHIICIFPRFNWMQQVTTICYSTPPPSPSMQGLQFYAIGGRANYMVCEEKGQHHCTKKKSQVYAFVFLDHSSVCNEACINMRQWQ